jgi:hypothetical protein
VYGMSTNHEDDQRDSTDLQVRPEV